MSRLTASLVAALVLSSGVSAAASETADKTTERVVEKNEATPTAAAPVLDSWAYERPSSSPALKTLLGTYIVLQGLDIYSTGAARRAGAHEANPVMDRGMMQATAVKAVTGLTTYYFVNRMAKKNRKGAVITMAILNGVTAAVVANNLKNSRR